jgi:hypothetical protein
MQRLIAIFFLIIFSVSFTEAGQFLKLPKLVAHYYDHMNREKMSFAGFLKQHYLTGHKDDGDKNEDSRLPFKSTEITNISSTFLPPSVVELVKPEARQVSELFLYMGAWTLTGHYFSIFHPPACS